MPPAGLGDANGGGPMDRLKHGWLWRRGAWMGNWQRRWCSVEHGYLYNCNNPKELRDRSKVLQGVVTDAEISEILGNGQAPKGVVYGVKLRDDRGESVVMYAETPEEQAEWALAFSGGRPNHGEAAIHELYHVNFNTPLGCGAFATVLKGIEKSTRNVYAVKIIKRPVRSTDIPSDATIEKEIAILTLLEGHPNIIELKEVVRTKTRAYLVLEYCDGGELVRRVTPQRAMTERQAANVIRQCLSALAFMHSHDIVHRDLKPENILLKQRGENSQVKIIDFGMAAFRGDPVEAVGTPEFMAPEIVELTSESVRRLRVDAAVDMWAIGIITYFLLTGRTPFEGDGRGTTEEEVDRILMRVSTGKWTFHPPQFRQTSEAAKDFIRSLLRVRAEERLTVREALASPWITQGAANPANYGGIYSSRRLAFKDQRPLRLSAARAAAAGPGVQDMIKAGTKPPLHKIAAAAAGPGIGGAPQYAMQALQPGLPAWMYNKEGQVAMPARPPGSDEGHAGDRGGAYGRGGDRRRPAEPAPWWQGTTFKTIVVLFVVHQLAGLLAGGGAERRRQEEARARFAASGGRARARRPAAVARRVAEQVAAAVAESARRGRGGPDLRPEDWDRDTVMARSSRMLQAAARDAADSTAALQMQLSAGPTTHAKVREAPAELYYRG